MIFVVWLLFIIQNAEAYSSKTVKCPRVLINADWSTRSEIYDAEQIFSWKETDQKIVSTFVLKTGYLDL